ncbi:MAG: hypothetical protein QOI78_157, partial [Actinomycetota bacterium]|nr:hypothetical protein [Actinomycetota bacterium]
FRESRFEGRSVLEAAFARFANAVSGAFRALESLKAPLTAFRQPDLSEPPGSVEFGGRPRRLRGKSGWAARRRPVRLEP